MYSIYLAQNETNGKVYIGQTNQEPERRWNRHKSEAKHGSELLFHRAIRKYGDEAFTFAVIDRTDSREEADELETLWIGMFKAMDRRFGYNLKGGGCVPTFTDEVKERISTAMKTAWSDPEFRERVVANRKGKGCGERNCNYGKTGEEHPRYGTTDTEEHKELLRQYMTERWQDPAFRDSMSEFLKNREIDEEWRKSMSEAAKRAWATGNHPRTWSEETLRKRSESMKRAYAEGRVKPNSTPETRKKQSAALKGRPWSQARRAAEVLRRAAKQSQ